jgi:hypothetical protein
MIERYGRENELSYGFEGLVGEGQYDLRRY